MVNWTNYIESLYEKYETWWENTITDVVCRQQIEHKASRLLLDLKVNRVQSKKEESDKRQEEGECFGVLEGLWKYAEKHVLLVGRPGSGKSTALIRLLLEQVNSYRAGQNVNKQLKIPVLVELRYYETSVLDLIQEFLKRHDPNLDLDHKTLQNWLHQGYLLLLVDGLNELPTEEAWLNLRKFRQNYEKTTPMIFTTRDLGVGGDLKIVNKLEIQPLTNSSIRDFVKAYLPEDGEQMLRQLGGRLHEFGQTPLLLMMLCLVFDETGNIPSNLGMAFRQFTQQRYEKQLKQDVQIKGDLRNWWRELLEHLALRMTQGREVTQLQVLISKQEAVDTLTEFLEKKKFDESPRVAKCWLDDLLKYHLIQQGAEDKIEFSHQLIQEYYTAESLLKQLPHLLRDEDRLKWEHLNYLKWTEPLALMLELVEDEKQALQIVQLAQKVDLRLEARLAGAVKPEFQAQTVGLIAGLEIPSQVKIQLLGITRSEEAIPHIQPALNHEDYDVRTKATEALVHIGSEAVVNALKQTLNYEDYHASYNAIETLKKIDSQDAIDALKPFGRQKDSLVRLRIMLSTVRKEVFPKSISLSEELEQSKMTRKMFYAPSQFFCEDDYRCDENNLYNKVANLLKQMGSPTTVDEWKKALSHEDYDVRCHAIYALGDIGSEAAIEELKLALQHEDYNVRCHAVYALVNIRSKAALEQLKLALKHEDADVRKNVVYVLDKIGDKAALEELKLALNDEESDVRRSAAFALGKIGDKAALEELKLALNEKEPDVRKSAASTLGNISSDAAIEALQKVLNNDKEVYVRSSAASALGNIGLEAGLEALQNALNNDKEADVRSSAAFALGNISSDAAIKALRNALNDEDFNVRIKAAEGLGKIANPDLMPEFNNILRTNTEINWLDTIAAVQERCKFYNYDIYQSPPPLPAQPTDSNVPTHVHNRIINTDGGNYIESNTGTYVQCDYINSTKGDGGATSRE